MRKITDFINKTAFLFFFYFLRDPVPSFCVIDNEVHTMIALVTYLIVQSEHNM